MNVDHQGNLFSNHDKWHQEMARNHPILMSEPATLLALVLHQLWKEQPGRHTLQAEIEKN
jgi:hypothetical protein